MRKINRSEYLRLTDEQIVAFLEAGWRVNSSMIRVFPN